MSHSSLPIDQVLPELKQALSDHANVVLVAAPGAGKTTRVPLELLAEPWLQSQKILILEPRRIATRNAAHFMAQQLSEAVGTTVGYRMRMESRTSTNTRIEVITEGLLTRMLQDDPELSGVGLIIFDEFHERNQHSDLGLALAHNCQQLFREDLKILVMSATLDEDSLSQQLQAPVVRSEGRSFAITTHYRPASEPLNTHRSVLIRHCNQVIREAANHPGDLLVFLPGVADIGALQRELQDLDALVVPLHGQLNDQQQKLALQPPPNNQPQKKIILATNIAESSVTIDGVRVVIDSGLERQQQFDVRSGIEKLVTQNISQASATQRQGRAGRQAEGVCYRLWAESQHHSRSKHITAEIAHSELSSLLLALRQWGADATELTWLSPPSPAALNRAQQLLQQLNILNPDGHLSAHGQMIADSGLEPRWAHSLICASQQGYGRAGAEVVALLQLMPHKAKRSDDLEILVQQAPAQLKQQAAKLAQNWIATLQLSPDHSPINLAKIIALAFPDRIARLRSTASNNQQTRYQLSSGAGVVLSPNSALQNHEWLAVADIAGQQSTVRLACKLDKQDIIQLSVQHTNLISKRIVIDWQSNGQLIAEQRTMLGKLTWQKRPLPALEPSQWDEAWCDYFRNRGLDSLPWDDQCLTLRQRMNLAYHSATQDSWPDVGDDALLVSLEQWLLPFLQQARHQKDLKKVDVYSALLSLLDWQQQQQLEQQLPTHIQVASGSRIRINYQENPPILAVKLQEMFGFVGQPSVLNGRLPLMIHLLSPARRPLAVTQDLPSFWNNAYPEVRKDMRGRYPKHPWPEDPLTAEATRFTKKRQ